MCNCKSLFKQTLLWKKKLKAFQERTHLLSGQFIKVFYKTATYSIQTLLSGPESGRLIKF